MPHYFDKKQESTFNPEKIHVHLLGRELEFYTASGVFSKEGLDITPNPFNYLFKVLFCVDGLTDLNKYIPIIIEHGFQSLKNSYKCFFFFLLP